MLHYIDELFGHKGLERANESYQLFFNKKIEKKIENMCNNKNELKSMFTEAR